MKTHKQSSGVGKYLKLRNEIATGGNLSNSAQQPQPESVTGSVPHRSCKGCPEYGLDRDCSGKCP